MKIILGIVFFTLTLFASSLNDAFVVYQTHFEDKKEGYYEKNDLLFFIVETEIDNKKLKKIHYEGKSMLKVNSLIKNYLLEKNKLPEPNNPYKGKLGQDLQRYVNENKINVNFSNLESRILVNRKESHKDIYKYVVVIQKVSLENKFNELLSKSTDVKFYLDNFVSSIKEKDDFKKLSTYYGELGLVEDFLIFQKKSLANDIYLVNYYESKNIFKEREILRKIINKNVDYSKDLLKEIPANYEVLNELITKSNNLEKLPLVLTALVHKYSRENNIELLKQTLLSNKNEVKNIDEYISLINLLNSSNEFFKSNSLLELTFLTLGHLELEKSLKNTTNKYFDEAKILFNKGINIPKIEELLVKSIEISPNHYESWNYLGAILVAQNKIKEALIVFNQAYQINSDSLELMANIANCYFQLGFKNLAISYKDYLKILNLKQQNNFVNKIIKKIEG